MSDIAITVEGLGKAYHIGLKAEIPDSIMSAIGGWIKTPFKNFRRLSRLDTRRAAGGESEDIFWALKDVSFEVKRGEVVGIIGRNGAGKSTLLKILSRITEPTTGRAIIRGRVSSLLEVGTGFHPELTGRDNVYMNGTILGMSKREIDRKFDEIIDFSGVEKFLDTPVKRYSSGMKVRLAFAVAAHLEPEILIIDEVLAVGDAEFQKKCLGKMQDVAGSGRTVLFVSHNMAAVENLCGRVLYLSDGTTKSIGVTSRIIEEYLKSSGSRRMSVDLTASSIERSGSGEALFTHVQVSPLGGDSTDSVAMGDGLQVQMGVRSYSNLKDIVVAIGLFSMSGQRIAGLNSADTAYFVLNLRSHEEVEIVCELTQVNLMPGSYYLNVQLKQVSGGGAIDHVREVVSFDINASDVYETGRTPAGPAIVYLPVKWTQISQTQDRDTVSDRSRIVI